LWENGSIVDLNTLIPLGSPLYLNFTYNINDQGEIAATGADATGNQHAVLLIPCDANHPNIAGCDYSMVEGSGAAAAQAAASAPTTATPQNLTPSQVRNRIHTFLMNRNRRFRPRLSRQQP
jgi:hypothetical protein